MQSSAITMPGALTGFVVNSVYYLEENVRSVFTGQLPEFWRASRQKFINAPLDN